MDFQSELKNREQRPDWELHRTTNGLHFSKENLPRIDPSEPKIKKMSCLVAELYKYCANSRDEPDPKHNTRAQKTWIPGGDPALRALGPELGFGGDSDQSGKDSQRRVNGKRPGKVIRRILAKEDAGTRNAAPADES